MRYPVERSAFKFVAICSLMKIARKRDVKAQAKELSMNQMKQVLMILLPFEAV